jgi:membrane protease YdiL (CAAX protease family)
MWLINPVLSALVNLVLLVALPFLGYYLFHRWRRGRRLPEIARRAGLAVGEPRYLAYALAAALLVATVLLVWPPPLEPFLRKGSAQHDFVGLGFGLRSVVLALVYGVVKTGFAEELLFRGLIAGSLGRRLSLPWANLAQAVIFLLPHLLILFVMPETWWILPVVFVGALFAGWLRLRSGSILGPWLIHATANVVMCLSVAARSAV